MAKKTTSKSTKSASTTTPKLATKAAAEAKPKAATKRKPQAPKLEAEQRPAAKDTHAAPEVEPKAVVAEPAKEVQAKPRARDPRLPAPGTVLQKLDRQGGVRCECTVEEKGIRFNGELYGSLSSAAMAASKELGLGGQAQNGFLFWGLVKQSPREKDPVAALDHAWARYQARAEGVLKAGVTDDNRAQVLATVDKHLEALEGLKAVAA